MRLPFLSRWNSGASNPTAPAGDSAPADGRLNRRTVFAGAGVAGAAAAAAVLMPAAKGLPGAAGEPVAVAADDAAGAEGYRLTAHVAQYYRTARV